MKLENLMRISSHGPYKLGESEKYRDTQTSMIPPRLRAKHLKSRRK